MSVGPDPEKRLHANRPFSVPWNSKDPGTSYSRANILAGTTPAAFGSEQSMDTIVNGIAFSENVPHKWLPEGYPLTVPKCVILSSLPYWTAYWKSTYFYGPSDVVGQMFTSPFLFGNYYYFDQWNDVDTNFQINDETQYTTGDSAMDTSPFFDNFDPPVPVDETEIWKQSYNRQVADLPPSPNDQIAPANTPPTPRYSQIIGNIRSNPYYEMHRQIMAAFRQAKLILESDPVDPIYVVIPEWLPEDIIQRRNGSLIRVGQKFNDGHGSDCYIVDVNPCYTNFNMAWGPAFPNPDDARNLLDFDACNVPFLGTVDPGFGTNVLHMYVGHPCVRYSTGNSIFDYQAWPLTPEGQWIGPIFLSTYTGAGLPFFQGRRAVWRDFGFAYGFTGVNGAQGVYDNYAGLLTTAADNYKEQFWKYRNFGLRLFTYPATWGFDWDTNKLWQDQKSDCASTQFYFGFAFEEFQQEFSNVDNWYADCSGVTGGPTHVKIATHYGNDPSTAGIQSAIDTFYPPIQRRVENYYTGIEPGCAEYYQIAIDTNGLADYNVQYGGSFASLLDPDAIVAYVRQYFAENP